MNVKYGYFGPKGTNSEEALYTYLGSTDVKAEAYVSIDRVLQAVKDGIITHGLIPIENSIEGTVNLTLDLMAQEKTLKIVGEVVLQIKHNILVKRGSVKDDVKRIISHPQALAQCRNYLNQNFPEAEFCPVGSTADAARIAAECGGVGAIGNHKAAEHYGLQILEESIHDCKENYTRFIVVSKQDKELTGPAKTSVVVSITDRPGGLYEILREFALANINLTKIESRPAKKSLGDYLFFIDMAGHPKQPEVKKCLENVEDMSASFKILGSYPVWNRESNPGHENTYHKELNLNELRQDVDIIDYQLVELLAKRTQLVSMIGSLKPDPMLIRDRKREQEVLAKVKTIAAKKGVSPHLLENVYEYFFDYFVELQKLQATRQADNK